MLSLSCADKESADNTKIEKRIAFTFIKIKQLETTFCQQADC